MNLPPPLVPANVDLRSMPRMPLNCQRLRDASIVFRVKPEEFLAAVLLWSAAWHQVPAASLPDEDSELCHLAGYGRDLKGWKRVREGALWKFQKCSDGRLYHPFIAELAIEVWEYREGYRIRTASAREAKAVKRSVTDSITDHVLGSLTHLNQTKQNKTKPYTHYPVSGGGPVSLSEALLASPMIKGIREGGK